MERQWKTNNTECHTANINILQFEHADGIKIADFWWDSWASPFVCAVYTRHCLMEFKGYSGSWRRLIYYKCWKISASLQYSRSYVVSVYLYSYVVSVYLYSHIGKCILIAHLVWQRCEVFKLVNVSDNYRVISPQQFSGNCFNIFLAHLFTQEIVFLQHSCILIKNREWWHLSKHSECVMFA